MTQMVRVHNFFVSSDGYGAGEGQSLERPFGHANPAELGRVGVRRRELAEPHRRRRHPRPGGLPGPRLPPQHRRRDHGAQQVQPVPRAVGGPPRVGGLVGRGHPVPHAGVRDDPPRPAVAHADRHHVPLRQRHAGRGARAGAGGRRRQGRAPGRRAPPRSASSSTPTSSTPCTSPSRRSSSAAGSRFWTSPDELDDRYEHDVVPRPDGVVHHLFWRRLRRESRGYAPNLRRWSA